MALAPRIHTPGAQVQPRASDARGATFAPIAATLAAVLAAVLSALVLDTQAAPPAGALPDPTRPPADLAQRAAARTTALTPAPAAEAASAPKAEVLPVLQSVQVPSHGRPSAMLDGQLLRVGDRLGAMQLVVIDTLGVTLRTPQGQRRIGLVDEHAKRPSGSIAVTRRAGFTPVEPAVASDREASAQAVGSPLPARASLIVRTPGSDAPVAPQGLPAPPSPGPGDRPPPPDTAAGDYTVAARNRP